MTAGDRLRAAREAAGHRSARQAASVLGVGYSTYLGHENGQNDFAPAQARKYADAFGVDAMWLMFGDSHQVTVQGLVDLLIRKGVITPEEASKL
jgi:hypothetical protein